MADTERVIKLLFKGDGRDLSKTTKALQRGFRDFEQSADAVAQPLNKAFGSILKLDAAAAALTITLIGLSLRAAGKFETAFNKTAAIIDTSDENLNQFRDDLLKYSTTSVSSLEDITTATFSAISAGISYKDTIASLSGAEKLATASQSTLDESINLIAKTINAYGLEASDAARLADIFFTTNKLGITTVSELSQSLAGVTGVAATAGVPIEEVTAALATLTASGVPTSTAVTQIKAVLSNLIKPSEGAKDAAKKLGIEFNSTALKSQGFQKFLLGVFDKADGNVDILGQLFGSVEALSGVTVLGANANDNYVKTLKEIEASSGNVDKALDKLGQSYDQTNQILANNINNVLVKLGDKILKNYEDLAGGITEIFRSLGVAIDAKTFSKLFDALDETSDRLSAFINEVAKTLPAALALVDFDGIVEAITRAGDAIGSLVEDFDPSDPQDLADAMQLVVDSVESLIDVSIGFLPVMEQVGSFIKEAATEFNKSNVDTKALVGTTLALAGAFVTLGPLIGTIVTGMVALEGVGIQVGGAFQLVFGAITLTFNLIKASVQTAELIILESLNFIIKGFDLLPNGLSESGRKTQIELQAITDTVREEMRKTGEGIRGGANSISNGFGRIIGSADDATIAITDYTAETEKSVAATEDSSVASIKLAKELGFYKDESEAVVVAEKARDKTTKAVTETTKSAAAEVDKFGLELRKITAGEFKAQLELDAAKVKAQAQIISSAFDSTTSSINSATVATVGLVNALSGATGLDRLLIIEQIELQNKLQQQGLDQQQELLDAMRERMALQRDFLTGDNQLEFSIRAPDNINGILEQFYLELLKDAKFFLTTEEGGKVITSGLI